MLKNSLNPSIATINITNPNNLLLIIKQLISINNKIIAPIVLCFIHITLYVDYTKKKVIRQLIYFRLHIFLFHYPSHIDYPNDQLNCHFYTL